MGMLNRVLGELSEPEAPAMSLVTGRMLMRPLLWLSGLSVGLGLAHLLLPFYPGIPHVFALLLCAVTGIATGARFAGAIGLLPHALKYGPPGSGLRLVAEGILSIPLCFALCLALMSSVFPGFGAIVFWAISTLLLSLIGKVSLLPSDPSTGQRLSSTTLWSLPAEGLAPGTASARARVMDVNSGTVVNPSR